MTGMTCLQNRNIPPRFTSTTRRYWSHAISSSGRTRTIPALLLSTSMRPCFFTVFSTAAITSFSAETSPSIKSHTPPSDTISLAIAAPRSAISTMTTAYPRFAKSRAVASPIPLAAPVIRATFFDAVILLAPVKSKDVPRLFHGRYGPAERPGDRGYFLHQLVGLGQPPVPRKRIILGAHAHVVALHDGGDQYLHLVLVHDAHGCGAARREEPSPVEVFLDGGRRPGAPRPAEEERRDVGRLEQFLTDEVVQVPDRARVPDLEFGGDVVLGAEPRVLVRAPPSSGASGSRALRRPRRGGSV